LPACDTTTIVEVLHVLPLESTAVAVYCVVVVGDTEIWPEGAATLPTPLSIFIEIADGAFQESCATCPGAIASGVEVKEIALTVTTACAVAVPPVPLARAV